MGTRADFYVGVGPGAEWLGSVAFDGHEWEEQPGCPLMTATDEVAFRAAVADIAKTRRDWTAPERGWPWPWDDSGTTDRSYWFRDGKAIVRKFSLPDGGGPNMADKQNVVFGTRSGLIVGIG